jgi:hypothetical protein
VNLKYCTDRYKIWRARRVSISRDIPAAWRAICRGLVSVCRLFVRLLAEVAYSSSPERTGPRSAPLARKGPGWRAVLHQPVSIQAAVSKKPTSPTIAIKKNQRSRCIVRASVVDQVDRPSCVPLRAHDGARSPQPQKDEKRGVAADEPQKGNPEQPVFERHCGGQHHLQAGCSPSSDGIGLSCDRRPDFCESAPYRRIPLGRATPSDAAVSVAGSMVANNWPPLQALIAPAILNLERELRRLRPRAATIP